MLPPPPPPEVTTTQAFWEMLGSWFGWTARHTRGIRRAPLTPRDSGLGYTLAGWFMLRRLPVLGGLFMGWGAATQASSIPIVQGAMALVMMALGVLIWHLGFAGWGITSLCVGFWLWRNAGR